MSKAVIGANKLSLSKKLKSISFADGLIVTIKPQDMKELKADEVTIGSRVVIKYGDKTYYNSSGKAIVIKLDGQNLFDVLFSNQSEQNEQNDNDSYLIGDINDNNSDVIL